MKKRVSDIYHLTPIENVSAILKNGLKADKEGNIFAFTNPIVANTIARDQVGVDRYCVFKILKKGVNGKVLKDNVAELSASFQLIIKQNWIEPRFLKKLYEEDTIFHKPTAWDYMIAEKIFRETKQQVDAKFEILSWGIEQQKKR